MYTEKAINARHRRGTHLNKVWFGFVRAALLPAVGTCVVLAFGAMPGRCCFLRVTHLNKEHLLPQPKRRKYKCSGGQRLADRRALIG